MNPTDTQTVTANEGREAFATIMGLKPVAPRTGTTEPMAQPTTPTNGAELAQAVAPTAADVNSAQPTPVEEVVAQAVPETPDPYASVVEAAIPSAPVELKWDEGAINTFKAVFGSDPDTYKANIDARLTAADLLKTDNERYAPVVQALDKMPPALKQAFSLAMEGKVAEAQNYLRDIPQGLATNKAAKDISVKDLVEQYFPGKIKADQWKTLEDPEADPEMVEALKARIGLLHETASEKHDNALLQVAGAQEKQAAADKARYEQYREATAKTISVAKNSPLKALLDNGTVDAVSSGAFLSDFLEADGLTPKPEAATLYLWAKHGEKLMQAAETRGYKRGKEEGALSATSRQPSIPPGQKRSQGDAPANVTDADRLKQMVFGALTSN